MEIKNKTFLNESLSIVLALSAVLIIASTLSGCNYTKLKGGEETPGGGPLILSEEEKAKISYQSIKDGFFQKKCAGCHRQGGQSPELYNYNLMKDNLAWIEEVVFVTKTMPKSGSLSAREKAELKAWIEMGGPENSQVGQPPVVKEPVITEPEIAATYESINKNIFQMNNCFDCHTPGGDAEWVALEKEPLTDPILGSVVPGKPDESKLIKALESTEANKRMPPPSKGFPAVKQSDIDVIRKWIENGAKD